MNHYTTKASKISGSQYADVVSKARKTYNAISSRSKRNPYVRSKYFRGEKVFLNSFWTHQNQKSTFDRKRRLVFYDCAIDLIRNTTIAPETRQDPHDLSKLQHRFVGIAKNGEVFFVQISENNRNGNKFFMSVFPAK